jgi:hypothetical protein
VLSVRLLLLLPSARVMALLRVPRLLLPQVPVRLAAAGLFVCKQTNFYGRNT